MIATKKLKYPSEEALLPSRELPTFRECFLAAFSGLHAQFEQITYEGEIGRSFVYYDGEDKDSLARSKHFARVAYNSATAACKVLAEQDTITDFNKKA